MALSCPYTPFNRQMQVLLGVRLLSFISPLTMPWYCGPKQRTLITKYRLGKWRLKKLDEVELVLVECVVDAEPWC